MPLMIWVCIIIEMGIQNWLDAGILLIIQMVNATLGWYETVKAADAVAALKASLKPVGERREKHLGNEKGFFVPLRFCRLRAVSAARSLPCASVYSHTSPPSLHARRTSNRPHKTTKQTTKKQNKKTTRPNNTATVKRDGVWANTDAGLLVPGDLVLLGSGSNVPADCIVNHGTIDVDQSGLTGESLPATMFRGDSAKMGSTVVKGEVEATVESTGEGARFAFFFRVLFAFFSVFFFSLLF